MICTSSFRASLGILLLFLGCYYNVCGRKKFGNYAEELLYDAGSYWLYQRSAMADTTFTTTYRCVMLTYVIFDNISDLAILYTFGSALRERRPKLYNATLYSKQKNLIRFYPLLSQDTTGAMFFYYRILHYYKGYCYVAQRVHADSDLTKEYGKWRNCEFWVKIDDTTSAHTENITEKAKKCQFLFERFCYTGMQLYDEDHCNKRNR
nr:uncharacterized protein LOC129387182 [Dermacentor andersoni]